MLKRDRQELTEGEKKELLHSGIIPRKGHWYSKDEVIKIISDWDLYSNYINVCLIEWDAGMGEWDMEDKVTIHDYAFDLYKGKDLDQLVGVLFQASIDGYAIRYVSTDCLTGLFLEHTRDAKTNIDEDVLNTLVELIRDRWGSEG